MIPNKAQGCGRSEILDGLLKIQAPMRRDCDGEVREHA